jgi:hypothetical protein
MTGVALFASFLAVLQYVQVPPEVTGYGFGATRARGVGDLPAAGRDRGHRCWRRSPAGW